MGGSWLDTVLVRICHADADGGGEEEDNEGPVEKRIPANYGTAILETQVLPRQRRRFKQGTKTKGVGCGWGA